MLAAVYWACTLCSTDISRLGCGLAALRDNDIGRPARAGGGSTCSQLSVVVLISSRGKRG
jgi:hypothetical protein